MTYYANYSSMRYSKAQLKIQQMAFVLIALVIFFALVALVYLTIRVNLMRNDAAMIEQDKARLLARGLSGVPELMWSGECDSCIDLDKALMLKNRTTGAYNNFFGLDYFRIEILYPEKQKRECTIGNYPDCNSITLIDKPNFGNAPRTYIALCRWDQAIGNEKCELGAVYAAGKSIT